MEHDPTGVANDFKDESKEHGNGVSPGPIPVSKTYLGQDEDGEKDREENVCAIVRNVEEAGLSETAGLESTELGGVELEVAVGVRIDRHRCGGVELMGEAALLCKQDKLKAK